MICKDSRPHGFTIVELLTVIVIVAILAAITVTAFRGLQRRANESASATAVEAANKKLEVYKITNRFYPDLLSKAEVQDYAKTTYQYSADNDRLGYCLTATTNNASMYGSNIVPTPAKGGCPGHAVDGVQPIINYVLNPSLENNSLPPYWSAGTQAGYTVGLNSTKAYKGTYSASVSVSTTTVLDAYVATTALVPTAGTYYASAYVYISSSANSFSNTTTTCPGNGLDVRFYTAGVPSKSACYNRGALNTWQRVSATLVAPAANTSFQIRFYPPAASGTTMYVDAVMVSNGSALSGYADGSTTGWVWTGAANGSKSTGLAK